MSGASRPTVRCVAIEAKVGRSTLSSVMSLMPHLTRTESDQALTLVYSLLWVPCPMHYIWCPPYM